MHYSITVMSFLAQACYTV